MKSTRLLYHPDENPSGLLIEELLDQLIGEIREKQERARAAGITAGARESALVVTNLEQAFLWQVRRGQATGQVRIEIDDPRR